MAAKVEQFTCQTCGAFQYSMLHHTKAEDRTGLDRVKMCNQFKKGQILFFEGNYPLGLYCVSRGSFKIYKLSADGKEQIVRFGHAGDFVGYQSLISDEPYDVTAEAIEDASACFIPKAEFLSLLAQQPSLSKALMQSLVKELGLAQDRLQAMAHKSVRERLAETLLMLHESFQPRGMRPQDEALIHVKLPREDIANVAGSSTETIIRLLSEFRDSGLVELQGKYIRLVNPRALKQLAQA